MFLVSFFLSNLHIFLFLNKWCCYNETDTQNLNICRKIIYEGWNFNSGNYEYLFTTDTK